MDPEVVMMIEEMAVTDQVNVGDLKQWRDDITKQKQKNRLINLRENERKQRAAVMASKRFKKKAKGMLKPKRKKTKHAAQSHAANNSEPAAATPPGPVGQPAAVESLDVGSQQAAAETPLPAAEAAASSQSRPSGHAPYQVIGDWKIMQVQGGTLRFNKRLQRLDAHCSQTWGTCKADRTLRKGPIGFVMLWLASESATKAEQVAKKGTCSASAMFDARVSSRAAFVAAAASQGGFFQEVLECELEARGSNDEPRSISM